MNVNKTITGNWKWKNHKACMWNKPQNASTAVAAVKMRNIGRIQRCFLAALVKNLSLESVIWLLFKNVNLNDNLNDNVNANLNANCY